MTRKRKGPTGGRACVQPGSEQTALSKNGHSAQGIKRFDPVEVFGWPRVVIERKDGRNFVKMENKPWGWSNVDKECLTDAGAERYAEKLRERLRVEQQREEERKAKRLAAKIRERLDRMEARNG
jgi:hypothetical protein